MPLLDNQRIIVTGGASGLGAAIAAAVEEAGGTPIVLDLSPSSNGFEAEQVDLCDTRAAEAVVERVASRHSGLDAVVTAAGTDACGRIDDVGGATWEPRRDRQPAGHRGGRPRRAAPPRALAGQGHHRRLHPRPQGGERRDRLLREQVRRGGLHARPGRRGGGARRRHPVTPGGMQTAFFDGRDEQYKPPPDAKLAPPEEVAAAAVFALSRPPGTELREMVVATSTEPSWP